MPQIVMSKEDNVNTNECYLSTTIGDLLDMDRGSFMRRMRAGEARQQQHPTSGTSQFKSWRDCFKVLKDTFGKFRSSELSQWRELQIEFERVLPNGRRPDVVIYSKRLVVVLEFKRMSNEFGGFLKQVRSYVKSLRASEAEGMKRKVKGVIIYTEMESAHDIGRIQKCSTDKLHEALLHLLGGFPEKA